MDKRNSYMHDQLHGGIDGINKFLLSVLSDINVHTRELVLVPYLVQLGRSLGFKISLGVGCFKEWQYRLPASVACVVGGDFIVLHLKL